MRSGAFDGFEEREEQAFRQLVPEPPSEGILQAWRRALARRAGTPGSPRLWLLAERLRKLGARTEAGRVRALDDLTALLSDPLTRAAGDIVRTVGALLRPIPTAQWTVAPKPAGRSRFAPAGLLTLGEPQTTLAGPHGGPDETVPLWLLEALRQLPTDPKGALDALLTAPEAERNADFGRALMALAEARCKGRDVAETAEEVINRAGREGWGTDEP